MTWTDNDYQAALRHMESGKGDAELAGMIRDYERINLTEPEERGAQEGFITQQFPTTKEFERPGKFERTEPGVPQHFPTAAPHAALNVGGFAPESMLPPGDDEGMQKALELRRTDPELPSASKRKDLFVPPEYINEPVDRAAVHPLYGPGSVMDYLPKAVGGGTDMWNEPSLVDFREGMRPFLGDRVKSLGLDSPEYAEFADRMWSQRVDEARQNGENVVRPAFMKRPDVLSNAVESMTTPTGDVLPSFALGFGHTFAPGGVRVAGKALGRDVDAIESIEEEFPAASFTGGMAGAFAPMGAASEIGAGISKGVGLGKTLGETAPGIIGTTARGAAAGAGTVGALKGAEDLGNVLTGDEASSPIDYAGAMGIGGILGGAAGLGGASVARLRNPGTEAGRQLNLLETALGEGGEPVRATRFLRGPRLPDAVLDAEALAKKPGPMRGASPTDILAKEVSGPILNAAKAERAQAVDDMSLAKEFYYSRKEVRNKPVALSSFADEAMDVVSGRQPGGRPLPAAQLPAFKELLKRSVDATAARSKDAQRMLMKDGGHKISLKEAVDLGLDVDYRGIYMHASPEVIARGPSKDELASLIADGEIDVIWKPRPVIAPEADRIAEGVDYLAKADTPGGARDSAWAPLQRAIRKDRDKMPWNPMLDSKFGKPTYTLDDGSTVKGWSAVHAQMHERLGDIEQRMILAGVPQGENVADSAAKVGIQKRALGFRSPEREPEDAALMSFSPSGPLYAIPAARYGRGLAEPPSPRGYVSSGGMRGAITGLGPMLKLSLDPLAGLAAEYGQQVGAGMGQGVSEPARKGASREVRSAGRKALREVKREMEK